jgi:mono/diheme cytochrome c family protein
MRPLLTVLAVLLAAVGLGLIWLTRPAALPTTVLPPHQADLANGERLFHAGGCASCHGERLEGGLELDTPFGLFRVPNISPAPDAGIGGWSDLDFVNAMKLGVSPAGRHYYPAFPYPSYTRMTVPDLLDLKAWLDTYPAVAQRVAGHELRFPWSWRRGLGLWKRRYLDDTPVVGLSSADPALERGRYLVEAVGHCEAWHTPRDRFGGPQRARWLAGAPSLEGEGRVPNVTPHEEGLADWSLQDLERYFRSGFTPDYDTVGGSMVAVQENLARLDEADRAAIAAYLKALPPQPDPPPDAPPDAPSDASSGAPPDAPGQDD